MRAGDPPHPLQPPLQKNRRPARPFRPGTGDIHSSTRSSSLPSLAKFCFSDVYFDKGLHTYENVLTPTHIHASPFIRAFFQGFLPPGKWADRHLPGRELQSKRTGNRRTRCHLQHQGYKLTRRRLLRVLILPKPLKILPREGSKN